MDDRKASSELPARRKIVTQTSSRAILHGHPLFSVVLSLFCNDSSCTQRDTCHKRCPRERFVCGVPVVAGEIGGGEFGLDKTVPETLKEYESVIVYGHGVFCTGKDDFRLPLQNMLKIENKYREEYLRLITRLS